MFGKGLTLELPITNDLGFQEMNSLLETSLHAKTNNP